MKVVKNNQSVPAKESIYYTASDLRRVIGKLGFVVTYVKGVSMRPLIWEGSHYVVVVALKEKPRIGDILAFEHIRREKTAYILHRLIDIQNIGGRDIYIMRGDNCIGCERICEEDIIGIVTEVYRNGGWRLWHAIPKKHFTTSDKNFRLYSKIWNQIWPLRKCYYSFRSFLSWIKSKLT